MNLESYGRSLPRPSLGRTDDYIYSRPYVPGDSLDRIDMHRTAKSGEPYVKVFSAKQIQETDEVEIVVDCSDFVWRARDFFPWRRRLDRIERLVGFVDAALQGGKSPTLSLYMFGTLFYQQSSQELASLSAHSRLSGKSPNTLSSELANAANAVRNLSNALGVKPSAFAAAGMLDAFERQDLHKRINKNKKSTPLVVAVKIKGDLLTEDDSPMQSIPNDRFLMDLVRRRKAVVAIL